MSHIYHKAMVSAEWLGKPYMRRVSMAGLNVKCPCLMLAMDASCPSGPACPSNPLL